MALQPGGLGGCTEVGELLPVWPLLKTDIKRVYADTALTRMYSMSGGWQRQRALLNDHHLMHTSAGQGGVDAGGGGYNGIPRQVEWEFFPISACVFLSQS